MNEFINISETETGKQVNFVDSRYYTKDDINYYPGVTNILGTISKGKQYETWLKSNGFNSDILAERAMTQGSNVHHAIEELLNLREVSFTNGNKVNYTRHEWVMISRFMDFYTNFGPKTIAVEKILVSDKLQFGTALDYVCEINGELYYIDHKTGSLYDSASMQISASIQLWNEHFPTMPISHGAVLHLDSTHRGRDAKGKKMQGEGWILSEIEDIDKNWEDFKAIHQIWKRQNPSYRPFNQQFPETYSLKEKE